MRNTLRGWAWVWAAWAYFHAFLPCEALAEPKAAVFGGVPIIDEKGPFSPGPWSCGRVSLERAPPDTFHVITPYTPAPAPHALPCPSHPSALVPHALPCPSCLPLPLTPVCPCPSRPPLPLTSAPAPHARLLSLPLPLTSALAPHVCPVPHALPCPSRPPLSLTPVCPCP
ncbi:hypothetical protein Pcinc_039867 [Petrolisthes cinctipes]|uniref:Uncharacterized protein n=1 Tax=Petrolisthes cinctipes TaxID=88211 RepID=A0AAE1EIQ1_PETCI|nr:hypothetical protein Pcinc_039867 [Petrolisthes cinctipes]